MHRILTLSERFLYCNDDQLFGARTSTSDFIDAKGRVKVWTWKSETDSWQSLGSEGQRKQIEQLRAGGSTTDGWRAGQQRCPRGPERGVGGGRCWVEWRAALRGGR